jgi:hypothetical protein
LTGLQDITKSLVIVADQSGMMKKGVRNIKSVETLGLVAEVCEKDYPDFSSAALMRVDIISMVTTIRRGIAVWIQSIEVSNDVDPDLADLESLTVTELKHRLWQLSQEHQVASPVHSALSTKIFSGHTNYVMCLQFSENILATGSYDATIKIWNIGSRFLQGYSHLLLYSFRKLKLADPVAMPIHLTHEYLARSNNNHCKGTEIFAGNLLLHSAAQNVRLKLLTDTPRYLIVAFFSIDPIVDRT